ncbi:MAG: phosphate ABC transporter substrate-binding protein PstS [Actinomycetota bacterium]|nr:phosphate ABC transporter substrate-binding protein PstS [Mycobacterium lentiflavum]MEE3064072.1 phosphate ABC transporter substrate-binding protein PstS [Actinomycetota bacterium]ULP45310.1 phosphate ABC transporter substrate-binding protein PstS [Mycobacterium lentiflavum]
MTSAVLTACGGDDNRHDPASVASSGPVGTPTCGGKGELTAEGSTAQQNAMAVFSHVWGQYCPRKSVSYNPTGSGAGREQFIAGHVDFAGSDSPLSTDQILPATKRCNGNPAWDLPLVFGPVALVYNLPEVKTLVVNSDALARILTGRIAVWNDPVLMALNPGVALPDTRIAPIYRMDSSGTTDNLQKFLTAAAPESWSQGIGTEFQGGVGEGALKSSGVIQAVRTTRGAIGYVEKGFADQAGLPYAQLATATGVVPLTAQTASTAIETATFVSGGNDLVLNLNSMYAAQQPGAYPLMLATYEIVCSKGYDTETAKAIKSFLSVAVNTGQANLSSAGYIPLTDKVKERLITAINAMQ